MVEAPQQKLMNIITKSCIRYEGVIHKLNEKDDSIQLLNVRSFGTEGRMGNPDQEIPPQPTIYPSVVFKSSEILSCDFPLKTKPTEFPWGEKIDKKISVPSEIPNKYEPSASIFDTLSSSINDKEVHKLSFTEKKEQYEQDKETFGTVPQRPEYGFRKPFYKKPYYSSYSQGGTGGYYKKPFYPQGGKKFYPNNQYPSTKSNYYSKQEYEVVYLKKS